MPVPGEVRDLSLIDAGPITYQNGEAAIEAYLARPRGAGPRPGLIVIHEAFGPVEHIYDLARRFANVGFTALAPNLYTRAGAPDSKSMDAVLAKMFALPDAQAVQDLEAAAAYLRAQPDSNGKVGCIGFCSGGRQTLLLACSSGQINAAVDCWGGFITRASPTAATTPERPTPIIDLLPQIHCPLYAVFAGEDQNPSPVDAELLKAKLAKASPASEVEVFADAGHAFLADYRPTYQEGPALRLWPKIVAFLSTHLR